jgi:hypothetical protein
MVEAICRVCGDVFTIWLGPLMQDGICPMTEQPGLCAAAMHEARRAAACRKACPAAFDGAGKIKPGGLAMILAAGIDPFTGLAPGAPDA